LSKINESLARKVQARNEYDKTIQETEAAYMKILESSQTLLHVLKRETVNLTKKKQTYVALWLRREGEGRATGGKGRGLQESQYMGLIVDGPVCSICCAGHLKIAAGGVCIGYWGDSMWAGGAAALPRPWGGGGREGGYCRVCRD
jgi:dsDNA-binding SOS-regulon protein